MIAGGRAAVERDVSKGCLDANVTSIKTEKVLNVNMIRLDFNDLKLGIGSAVAALKKH